MGPPLPQNLALLSKQYLPLSQKAPPLPSSPPPTQPPLPPSQYSLPHLPPALTTTTLTLTKFIMTTDSLVSFYNNLSPKEQYTAWHYLQLQILGRNTGNLVVEDNINVGHGEDVIEMVEKKPKLEIIDFEVKEGDSSSRDEICHIYCTNATEDRTEKSHKNGENKVVCLLFPDDYDVDEIAIHVKEKEKENLNKKKKNPSHIEEENYSTKKKISNLKRVLGLGRNAGNLVVEDNINVGHGEYFEDVNEMVEKKPKLEIIDFEEKEGGSSSRDEICHIYCTDATEDRTERSHRNGENKVVCLLFPDDYDLDDIAIHLKEEEKENISKKKKNHSQFASELSQILHESTFTCSLRYI